MSWTCPKWSRFFKHKNQIHSCLTRTIDDILGGKSERVVQVVSILLKHVSAFGDVKISATRNAVMVTSGSTFLAIKPAREWVNIEFLLDREVTRFPVHKIVRASRHKVAHFVRIEEPREITRTVLNLLKESFILTDC